MATSYTERTLAELRRGDEFVLVEKVEYWTPFPKPHGRRVDLFGIIDIVALAPGRTLGVQSTSIGALSAHKKKLREHPCTREVLRAGWELEIWAWEKKANRWTHRVIKIQLEEEGATHG